MAIGGCTKIFKVEGLREDVGMRLQTTVAIPRSMDRLAQSSLELHPSLRVRSPKHSMTQCAVVERGKREKFPCCRSHITASLPLEQQFSVYKLSSSCLRALVCTPKSPIWRTFYFNMTEDDYFRYHATVPVDDFKRGHMSEPADREGCLIVGGKGKDGSGFSVLDDIATRVDPSLPDDSQNSHYFKVNEESVIGAILDTIRTSRRKAGEVPDSYLKPDEQAPLTPSGGIEVSHLTPSEGTEVSQLTPSEDIKVSQIFNKQLASCLRLQTRFVPVTFSGHDQSRIQSDFVPVTLSGHDQSRIHTDWGIAGNFQKYLKSCAESGEGSFATIEIECGGHKLSVVPCSAFIGATDVHDLVRSLQKASQGDLDSEKRDPYGFQPPTIYAGTCSFQRLRQMTPNCQSMELFSWVSPVPVRRGTGFVMLPSAWNQPPSGRRPSVQPDRLLGPVTRSRGRRRRSRWISENAAQNTFFIPRAFSRPPPSKHRLDEVRTLAVHHNHMN